MNDLSLVYPMTAMVMLTFTVLAVLFRSRVQAVARGEVSPSYFKTYQGEAEPAYSMQLSRQFKNIFETPTLFYAACLTAIVTGQSGLTLQLLAWTFVLLRVVHFFIHVGKNKLRPRITVFFASCVVLAVMWTTLAIGVSMAG
jgi:hypothetical protein